MIASMTRLLSWPTQPVRVMVGFPPGRIVREAGIKIN
jgi:hypothetical protein